MANKNPTPKFKKGNTAAKGHGRPKMTAKQKAMSLATRTEFKLILTRYAALPMDQLHKTLQNKNLSVLDHIVVQALINGAADGEANKVDWVLNHLFGKPVDEQHINLKAEIESTQIIDLKSLTDEELQIMKKAMKRKTEK